MRIALVARSGMGQMVLFLTGAERAPGGMLDYDSKDLVEIW